MANRLSIAELAEMRLNKLWINMRVVLNKFPNKFEHARAVRVLTGEQFHPVTGGKNESFLDACHFLQRARSLRQIRRRDRQPLSQIDRGRFVIYAARRLPAVRGSLQLVPCAPPYSAVG